MEQDIYGIKQDNKIPLNPVANPVVSSVLYTLMKIEKGFTLVEMLVVTAAFMLLGVLLVSSLFSILKSNTKAELMKEIRQSGGYALSVMSRIITNGIITDTDCSAANSSIVVKNPNGGETTFECGGDPAYIASNSAQLTSTQQVKISSCSNVFQCETIGENVRKVTISFVLIQQGSSPRPEDQAQQTFQKVIVVRNE